MRKNGNKGKLSNICDDSQIFFHFILWGYLVAMECMHELQKCTFYIHSSLDLFTNTAKLELFDIWKNIHNAFAAFKVSKKNEWKVK